MMLSLKSIEVEWVLDQVTQLMDSSNRVFLRPLEKKLLKALGKEENPIEKAQKDDPEVEYEGWFIPASIVARLEDEAVILDGDSIEAKGFGTEAEDAFALESYQQIRDKILMHEPEKWDIVIIDDGVLAIFPPVDWPHKGDV